MDANDEKINGVIQFASTLCREGHNQGTTKQTNCMYYSAWSIKERFLTLNMFVVGIFVADKIGKKADSIRERRDINRKKALDQMEKLKDQLQLHQYLQVH